MSEDRSLPPRNLPVTEPEERNDPPGVLLNANSEDEQASVLVTGLGRSGTTMASRVLCALGLFMGDHLSPQTNEDVDFRRAIKKLRNVQNGSLSDFRQLCQDRNARFDRWGFKYPQAWNYLPELVAAMRSPRVVIMSRDPFAIGMRRASILGTEVLPTAAQSAASMLLLYEKVRTLSCPVLILSYEKALSRPRECVSMLARFCGIDADPATLLAAAEVIDAGHPAYFGDVDRNNG